MRCGRTAQGSCPQVVGSPLRRSWTARPAGGQGLRPPFSGAHRPCGLLAQVPTGALTVALGWALRVALLPSLLAPGRGAVLVGRTVPLGHPVLARALPVPAPPTSPPATSSGRRTLTQAAPVTCGYANSHLPA